MLKRDRGEDSLDAHRPSLWPYGHGSALLAAPLCWLIFALIFLATDRYLQWPNAELAKILVLLVATISFFPTLLSLFDYIARSRGMLDING